MAFKIFPFQFVNYPVAIAEDSGLYVAFVVWFVALRNLNKISEESNLVKKKRLILLVRPFEMNFTTFTQNNARIIQNAELL